MALTCINLGLVYLRARPLVPAATLSELRVECADNRRRLAEATSRIAVLEARLGNAIAETEWWREQYKEAKALLDQVRRPWQQEPSA